MFNEREKEPKDGFFVVPVLFPTVIQVYFKLHSMRQVTLPDLLWETKSSLTFRLIFSLSSFSFFFKPLLTFEYSDENVNVNACIEFYIASANHKCFIHILQNIHHAPNGIIKWQMFHYIERVATATSISLQ